MVIDHCSYDFFTISYWHLISDISTLILTFDQGRQKLPLLTPKKCKNEGQKKGNSPNPCWHGLFAKNRVQIGLIWPPWPRLYFTSAYRGSPPCTLFQHPDNREIGYSNVLHPPTPWPTRDAMSSKNHPFLWICVVSCLSKSRKANSTMLFNFADVFFIGSTMKKKYYEIWTE